MVKVGQRVMYRLRDLEEFLDRRTVTHTGELEDADAAPPAPKRKARSPRRART